MNALAQQVLRDEARELLAMNPASQARVIEAPERANMVDDLAQILIEDCADVHKAMLLNDAYEPLVNDTTEILMMVGECFYDCHAKFWTAEDRRPRLAILGQQMMDLVWKRAMEIAEKEIDN